jgi:hypothetical protein
MSALDLWLIVLFGWVVVLHRHRPGRWKNPAPGPGVS